MGGKQSQIQRQPSRALQSQNTHPKLAGAQILQLENNESYFIEMKHSVGSQQVFKKWEQNIKKYSHENKHVEALYFPSSLSFKEQGMCGRSGVIRAKYDFFPYLLKDEVRNRKAIGQSFSENELWYMLYILCCAGMGVHKKDYILGDVRPDNVFVNQNGQIRLSNLFTFFDQSTNYHKFLTAREKAFVAPEQILELQSGKLDSCVDLPKAQCFSIGLTMLSAILLTNQSDLYIPEELQFKQQQFNHEITTLKTLKNYNQCLLEIVSGLCEYDPRFRLSCEEIVDILEPFEDAILELEEFEIRPHNLPENIRKKIQNQALIGSNARGSYAKVVNLNSSQHQVKRPPSSLEPRLSSTNPPPTYQMTQLPPVQHPEFSRQLPSIRMANQQPPHFMDHPIHSAQSNQTNFTFQAPNNPIYNSRQYGYHQPYINENSKYHPNNLVQNTVNREPYNFHAQRQHSYESPRMNEASIKVRHAQNEEERFVLPPQIKNKGYSNNSNPSEISVYKYASKVDSYIPPPSLSPHLRNPPPIFQQASSANHQQRSINQVPYQINPQKPSVPSIDRQSFSLNQTNFKSSSDSSNLYKSYEDAMRDVDRKLEQSRRMFPQ